MEKKDLPELTIEMNNLSINNKIITATSVSNNLDIESDNNSQTSDSHISDQSIIVQDVRKKPFAIKFDILYPPNTEYRNMNDKQILKEKHDTASRLQEYMLERDCYDPRYLPNFPNDILAPRTPNEINNDDRRALMRRFRYKNGRFIEGQISKYLYEIWRVHHDFSLEELSRYIEANFISGTIIQCIVFKDNEVEMLRFGIVPEHLNDVRIGRNQR